MRPANSATRRAPSSAAEKGHRRVAQHEVSKLRTPVWDSERAEVREQLVREGYTVHPDGTVTW